MLRHAFIVSNLTLPNSTTRSLSLSLFAGVLASLCRRLIKVWDHRDKLSSSLPRMPFSFHVAEYTETEHYSNGSI